MRLVPLVKTANVPVVGVLPTADVFSRRAPVLQVVHALMVLFVNVNLVVDAYAETLQPAHKDLADPPASAQLIKCVAAKEVPEERHAIVISLRNCIDFVLDRRGHSKWFGLFPTPCLALDYAY
mmetsp:Transcript_4358/g.3545  ORF Transcript_4358/g.3545 Transcript_4358/m.3545 type:complete len:123 (+) Transcript_4358:3-371(+)